MGDAPDLTRAQVQVEPESVQTPGGDTIGPPNHTFLLRILTSVTSESQYEYAS